MAAAPHFVIRVGVKRFNNTFREGKLIANGVEISFAATFHEEIYIISTTNDMQEKLAFHVSVPVLLCVFFCLFIYL